MHCSPVIIPDSKCLGVAKDRSITPPALLNPDAEASEGAESVAVLRYTGSQKLIQRPFSHRGHNYCLQDGKLAYMNPVSLLSPEFPKVFPSLSKEEENFLQELPYCNLI